MKRDKERIPKKKRRIETENEAKKIKSDNCRCLKSY